MSEPDSLIFFGLDGILFADAVRKQRQRIEDAEKKIKEDMRLIKAILKDIDSPIGKKDPEEGRWKRKIATNERTWRLS